MIGEDCGRPSILLTDNRSTKSLVRPQAAKPCVGKSPERAYRNEAQKEHDCGGSAVRHFRKSVLIEGPNFQVDGAGNLGRAFESVKRRHIEAPHRNGVRGILRRVVSIPRQREKAQYMP